ncbi:SRPBCC family protein [Paraoerskovia marina]|uniref:Carbon monoxide dehydrogenase subunit G n=1 Tax=Paraoerskovia marina TaxID=545619 RepID=A0A1H1MCT8_9CELL|nr:SRPBCC family protein [Paraoerskovia marina]SDR83769.1 Carbon monoxide dehydrogenase subunit G [Paraoerskovia marina]
MALQEIIETRVVDAPHEAVWDVLTDIRNAATTLRGVENIELVDGDEYEVGLRWRETRKVFGMRATEEMWVASVDPQSSTRVDADNGGVHYSTRFDLTPIGDKTRIVVRFSSAGPVSPSAVQRATTAVFGRLGERMTRSMLRSDLADIEKVASGTANEMAITDGTASGRTA